MDHVATATAEVWQAAVEARPEVSKVKHKRFPLYDDLTMLFEGSVATGTYAIPPDASSDQDGTTKFAARSNFNSETCIVYSPRNDPSEADSLSANFGNDMSPKAPKAKKSRRPANSTPVTPRVRNGPAMMIARQFGDLVKSITEDHNRTPDPSSAVHVQIGPEASLSKAVSILQHEYDHFDDDKMAKALDALGPSPWKTTIFVNMAAGSKRDAWLMKQIE